MKSTLVSVLFGCTAALLPSAAARAADPPLREGLRCTVVSQRVTDGMRLEIEFSNETTEDLSLAPGPHLVLYRDAQAGDAMGTTARADRVLKTPLVVPASGHVVALYGIAGAATEALRCNEGKPAAAALFFYQFNQRPQFRCLLQQFDLEMLPMKAECPGARR